MLSLNPISLDCINTMQNNPITLLELKCFGLKLQQLQLCRLDVQTLQLEDLFLIQRIRFEEEHGFLFFHYNIKS